MRGNLGVALAAVLTVNVAPVAFGQELPAWLTERRIIGENNLESIEDVRGTDAYDKAAIVARVETSADGDGFCTASRVADDIFLTNYHCYEYKPCEEIQFHLGYERDLPQSEQIIAKCAEVLSYNLKYDYALYRVRFDGDDGDDGDGSDDGEFQLHPFSNLNASIPDNSQTGVTKDFAIRQTGSITDIKVKVEITHTYIGDLEVILTSPSGTAVTLHARTGGSDDNINRTYGVAEGLRSVVGQAAAGTWKLRVRDTARSDTGRLNAVTFSIKTSASEVAEKVVTEADFPIATLWVGSIFVDQPLLVASHPAARLKEIDRSDACKLRTVSTEIVSERETLTHTCDTEGGSSGSPVLDRDTGYVVALHWGGTNEYNLAIPMAKVVEHIRSNVSASVFGELTIAR